MKKAITTATELIDAIGGNAPASVLFGVTTAQVSNMRRFGVIPPKHFFTIQAKAKAGGFRVADSVFKGHSPS